MTFAQTSKRSRCMSGRDAASEQSTGYQPECNQEDQGSDHLCVVRWGGCTLNPGSLRGWILPREGNGAGKGSGAPGVVEGAGKGA